MDAKPAERIAALASDPALASRVRFVLELDALKQVLRRNSLADGSRRENTAEHSWHLVMMGLTLAEYAREPVDAGRVAMLLMVHDVVEIDAGDTFVYDEAGQVGKAEREQAAADRIFGLLPVDQRDTLRAAWDEFENGSSAEARFARSIDRFQPLLLNAVSGGLTWREHAIPADRVRDINSIIDDGAPELWELAQLVIDDAVAHGTLSE